MLTKNDLIEALFYNKQMNECLARMEPAHLRDDLKSEVLEILLNQTEEKIIDLHNQGNLVYYAIRLIVTTIKSPRSNFFKTFRSCKQNPATFTSEFTHPSVKERLRQKVKEDEWIEDELPADYDDKRAERIERELLQEPVYELILKIKPLAYQEAPQYLTELYPAIGWYKQHMLSLYMRFGTYRAVERETGIQHYSCYKTIQQTIQQLREYANAK